MRARYDFYFSLTNPERRKRAERGLNNGDLVVKGLRNENKRLTAAVQSASGHAYQVSIDHFGMACECPDFPYRCTAHKRPCKHLLAAMIADQRQPGTPTIVETWKVGRDECAGQKRTLKRGELTTTITLEDAEHGRDRWGRFVRLYPETWAELDLASRPVWHEEAGGKPL